MEGNWELYRIFVAVAREGNISRAAARLFVSQSAVSQSVKQLEQRLEVPLFHRTPKGVVLTREGETLYSYAVTATGLLESAGRALAEMTALRAGHIRIGASDTVCSLFLVDVLRRFHAEHPDITINVLNRTSDEAVELLRQGEVDMAFVNLPYPLEEAFAVRQVMRIHDCFVTGDRYAHLARRTVTLAEVAAAPLLMLERASNSRRAIDAFFTARGLAISPAIELGSHTLLFDFARIGFGVAAVIEEAAEEQIKKGGLRRLMLSEPLPARGIGLVTRKGIALSAAAGKLEEMMG